MWLQDLGRPISPHSSCLYRKMLWFMVSMTTVWQLPVPTTAEKGSEESLRLCRLSSRDDSCGFIEFAFLFYTKSLLWVKVRWNPFLSSCYKYEHVKEKWVHGEQTKNSCSEYRGVEGKNRARNQKTTVQEVDRASGQNSEAGGKDRDVLEAGYVASGAEGAVLEARWVDRQPRAALQVAGNGDRGLLAWVEQDQTMERWTLCWVLHMADSWLSQQWCKEAKRHWRLGLLCITSFWRRDRVTPSESLKSLFFCWIGGEASANIGWGEKRKTE